jgi:hypothetical protein
MKGIVRFDRVCGEGVVVSVVIRIIEDVFDEYEKKIIY